MTQRTPPSPTETEPHEFPHVVAAFINALAEEGTKEEAIHYLQKQWNEKCWLRAALRERTEAEIKALATEWKSADSDELHQVYEALGIAGNMSAVDEIVHLKFELAALRERTGAWQPLTFRQFSEANRTRCESPQGFNHALGSWSTSDWFLAMIGELGEAANVAKKLNRVRDGIPGNKETPDELQAKLRRELADAFVYMDLAAQSLGFNIADAAVDVFNAKSAEIGYPAILDAAPLPQGAEDKR